MQAPWRRFYIKWFGEGLTSGLLDALTWIIILGGLIFAVVLFLKWVMNYFVAVKGKSAEDKKRIREGAMRDFLWAVICASLPILISVLFSITDAFGLSQITSGSQPNFLNNSLNFIRYVCYF